MLHRLILSSRQNLRLLQTIALLPLGLVVLLFFLYQRNEHDRELSDRRLAAYDVTREFQTFLQLNQSGLDLAGRIIVKNLGSPHVILAETLLTHPAVTSLIFTSREGMIFEVAGDKVDAPPAGTSIADTDAFREASTTLRAHVSDIARDPNDDDELLFILTVPMLDRVGRFKGVIQGTIDIAGYTAQVASEGRFKSQHFIVTSLSRKVIYAPPGTGLSQLDPLPKEIRGHLTDTAGGAIAGSPFLVFNATEAPDVTRGWWYRGLLASLVAAAAATALVIWRMGVRTRQIEAANDSKTAFLAMTSHEIRTPLNAIIGLSECLIGQARDGQSRNHLITIRSAGELLLHVVSDLLDLSRVEAGRLDLRPGPVDLHGLAREVSTLFALQASRQQLALSMEVAIPEDLRVAVDGDRLRQVLVNLVGNALKFTRQGSVRLRIEPLDTMTDHIRIRFAVIDTGPGIPPEARSRLFEPYFRILQPGKPGPEGTGLGLNISRRIVGLLGGSLDLRSCVGVGSEFFFDLTLPLLPSPPKPAPPGNASAPSARLHVLAADDNPANQEVLHALLEGQCARLVIVGTAADALRELRAGPFEVALIDLEMPDGDGFTVVREFLANPGASAGGRLIAVSSHSPDTMRDRCLAAGFFDYVGKPLRRKLLCEALAKAALVVSPP